MLALLLSWEAVHPPETFLLVGSQGLWSPWSAGEGWASGCDTGWLGGRELRVAGWWTPGWPPWGGICGIPWRGPACGPLTDPLCGTCGELFWAYWWDAFCAICWGRFCRTCEGTFWNCRWEPFWINCVGTCLWICWEWYWGISSGVLWDIGWGPFRGNFCCGGPGWDWEFGLSSLWIFSIFDSLCFSSFWLGPSVLGLDTDARSVPREGCSDFSVGLGWERLSALVRAFSPVDGLSPDFGLEPVGIYNSVLICA